MNMNMLWHFISRHGHTEYSTQKQVGKSRFDSSLGNSRSLTSHSYRGREGTSHFGLPNADLRVLICKSRISSYGQERFNPSDHNCLLPILEKIRLYSLNETFDITQRLPTSNCLVSFVLGKSYLNDFLTAFHPKKVSFWYGPLDSVRLHLFSSMKLPWNWP